MAPIEKVFAFHLDPGNLIKVGPPASKMELITVSDEVMSVGTRVVVRSIQSGIHVRIEAEVTALEEPVLMEDRQVSGPFSSWIHSHRFDRIPGGTRLTDSIEYSLPMGPLGGLVMGRTVARDLESTFAYRQEQTRRLLEEAENGTTGT